MFGLGKTIEVIRNMMNSVCDFLTLTMESILDFDGVLPTLDLSIWVREDNMTMYMFYSKPMASNMCLEQRSAIRLDIIDDFAQK